VPWAVLTGGTGVSSRRQVVVSWSRRSHDSDLVKFLHPDHQVADAHGQLHDMIQQLITEAARGARLRDDVDPAELAGYCLHALTGAAALTSDAAVDRLVTVIVDGLQPPR
jgi:hypothetical protein